MAISMLLLGLIVGPVIQSYNLTQRAQVMVHAQNTARTTLEKISREISEAMFVYDNTRSPIIFPIPEWDTPGPNRIDFEVYGAKIDLVLPKLVMHCNDPNHPDNVPRDYDRGDEAWPPCPVDNVAGHDRYNIEARPASPRQPDDRIVRYFIGLRENNPAVPYINSYDKDSGQANNQSPNNTFVLYRAEFSLKDSEDKHSFKWLVPAALGDNAEAQMDYLFGRDTEYGREGWKFFYDERPCLGDGKTPVWQNWQRIARVVGPERDIDLVRVKWDKNHTPIEVTPAVRFTPTGVDNDTMAATYVSDEEAEFPNATPTSFRATNGLWCPGYRVVVYTGQYDRWYYTDEFGGPDNKHIGVFDKDGNLCYDMTSGDYNSGTQELMFTVDPERGTVSFAFPALQPAVLTGQGIKKMNQDFLDEYDRTQRLAGRGQAIRVWKVPLPVPNARIVPGSEILIGPDMMPGPNYGRPTRYTRVPLHMGDPGRNQYKIDYDTNPVEIQFSSARDENIPPAPDDDVDPSQFAITLYYKFHNNTPDMIVKADYATKMLISISLAMRLYDENSGKVHVVELSNRVRLRNAMR